MPAPNTTAGGAAEASAADARPCVRRAGCAHTVICAEEDRCCWGHHIKPDFIGLASSTEAGARPPLPKGGAAAEGGAEHA